MPRGRPRKSKEDVLLKSAELIGWALGGLEREIAETRARLTALTAQASTLRARLGGGTSRTSGNTGDAGAGASADAAAGGRRRRRRMSPEARRRISEMMKKRWAERRRQKG